MRLCRRPERFALLDHPGLAPSVSGFNRSQTFQSVAKNRVLLPESFALCLAQGLPLRCPVRDNRVSPLFLLNCRSHSNKVVRQKQEGDRVRSAFFAMVAHDIHSPLATITFALDLLREEPRFNFSKRGFVFILWLCELFPALFFDEISDNGNSHILALVSLDAEVNHVDP